MLTWTTIASGEMKIAPGSFKENSDKLTENVEVKFTTHRFEYYNVSVSKDYAKDYATYKFVYSMNGEKDYITMTFNMGLSSWLEANNFEGFGDEAHWLAWKFSEELGHKHTLPSSIVYKISNYLDKYMGKPMDFAVGGKIKSKFSPQFILTSETSTNEVSKASQKLPGVMTKVYFPCECRTRGIKTGAHQADNGVWIIEYGEKEDKPTAIWNIVQHLNDAHKWTREKIADWLDELHDSGQVNLEFSPWGEEPVEEEKPKPTTQTMDELKAKGWVEVGFTKDDGKVYLASPDALSLGPFSIGEQNGN